MMRRAVALTSIVCVVAAVALAHGPDGADLAPLFTAARLLAAGKPWLIYAHDPGYLDIIISDAWISAADSVGYDVGRFYPYLYSPLWAGLVAPLTCVMDFQTFHAIVRLVNLAALGLTVLITAARWNPTFLKPLPLLLCFASLALSWAVFRGVWLGQIQPILILLVVVAIAASQSGRPAFAGAALALAASFKLTPAVLALYWVLTKRRDCALWFIVIGAALALSSLDLVGEAAHVAFLARLAQIGGSLITVPDNQSLTAWLGYAGYPTTTMQAIHLYATPLWIKVAVLASAVCAVATIARVARTDPRADAAAMAAIFLVATLAAPVAWKHHYIFLVMPLLLIATDAAGCLFAGAIAVLLSTPVYLLGVGLAEDGTRVLMWNELVAGLLVLAFLIRRAAATDRVSRPIGQEPDSAPRRAGAAGPITARG